MPMSHQRLGLRKFLLCSRHTSPRAFHANAVKSAFRPHSGRPRRRITLNQLTLDLSPPPAPAFDTFIAERNREVIAALTAAAPPAERFVHLWGEGGSGKSHLLNAWVEHAHALGRAAIYLDARSERLPDFVREASAVAVDHVDDLDPDDQITLFSVFNAFKESGGRLLTAGRLPPAQLALRPDLATRLASGLVLEVKPLSDNDKLAALRRHAKARQLNVPDEVFRYLLTHWRRDLSSLTAMLDTLDRYSLALQRPVTVPLVKNVLQSRLLQD